MSFTTLERLGVVFSIMGLLAVGGCVASTDASQVELLTYEVVENQGSPQAAFEGRLVARSTNRYLYGATGYGDFGMVFPEGTALSQDGSDLVLPDGTALPIGKQVSLGGGYYPGRPLPDDSFDEYFYVHEW